MGRASSWSSWRLPAWSMGTVAMAILAIALLASRSAMRGDADEYEGVYRWPSGELLHVQRWPEIDPTGDLAAFDADGTLRTLYATAADRFVAGSGAGMRTPIESRLQFHRNPAGRVVSVTWRRQDGSIRQATREAAERHDAVQFPGAAGTLAGTLIRPPSGTRHPAIVLVHGSGAQDWRSMLPYARFLVARGVALLGYDKRGVGGSSGDWSTASFEDLAGDVGAAVAYLRTRADIDATRIGVLRISQAGWVMPIAATRDPALAFLISVSGAGVSPAETTIDHAGHEMSATGVPPEMVDEILALMRLEYGFARTRQGWPEYAAARASLAERMGTPPAAFPGSPTDPHFDVIRRLYLHDPVPTLRAMRTPALAIFGALDNNILPEKNRAAWETALAAGGHPDYTLRILPHANHLQLQARTGTNAEMRTLQRFVPEYATTVDEWLMRHIGR